MKKHLIITGVVVLVLLLLGILGYAWSLGKVDEVAPLSAHIEVLEGKAEIKKAQADAFQTVTGTSTAVEAGDTVRADKGGVVEIIWGDQGVSRLEDGSEVIIESAPDFTADEPSAISLKLTAGRIWSRMVKVLDLDKPMQVKAGDVVATVRGTTYGVELNESGTRVVVDDSVVSVDRGDGNDTMIADLQGATIGHGTSTIVMDSSEGSAWRKQEQDKDYRFDQRYADWVAKREAKRSDRIRTAPKGMVRLGERLRMMAAGKDRKALASAFARRAMALSIADPDQADKALALMQDRMDNAGGGREVQRELNALQSFMNRTDLDGPKNFGVRAPSRGLLKKMREHRLAMAKVDLDRLYREALDIDEDIDELLYMADNRRDASITIASLLTRIDRIDEAAKKLSDQDQAKLSKKTAALRRRLERWFDLKTAIIPTTPTEPIVTPTSTVEVPEIPGIPGTQPPVIKPPTGSTTTQPVPTTRVYQRLELVPTPSAMTVGSRSIVRAYGVRADGGVDDITSSVRFSLVTGALGTMTANVFSAAFAGTAKINGTFTDPQGVRTAAAEVLVTEPVKADPNALVSVAIVTTSPTTVGCGSSIPIKVMGTYGDGSQKDITIMASYGTNDSKLGYATDGKILVFCPAQTSSVVITATVTDRGITKSGSITITVNPDPASGAGGGGRRGYTNYIP